MFPKRFFIFLGLCLILFLAVAPAQATVHEVQVGNFFFSPANTVVNPGDTVRWVFTEGTHTSTSEASSPKQWDSGTKSSGIYEVVFDGLDGPGPYPYLCSIHSSTMKDTIRMSNFNSPELVVNEIASGLHDPVYATAVKSDTSRIYIVQQDGLIKILKGGVVLSRPFLDISSLITADGERGLLGLAFHPQYPDSPYIYVNYIDLSSNTRISRFTVSSDPDSVDVSTEKLILPITQPFANHNGGMLEFSPIDGYLYLGFGDGGSGGDPGNRAQNTTLFLGKMLRIDVNTTAPYVVPPDNPFVGKVDTLPEIWDIGMRNPWRWCFDRATGNRVIADVGQDFLEEINVEQAGVGGFNYGWRLKEGPFCYTPPSDCDPTSKTTDPVSYYEHEFGRCSIIGGFVYRGCAMSELYGTYFFGDYCTGEVWAAPFDGTSFGPVQKVFDLPNQDLVSFGEDAAGEILVVLTTSRKVLRIEPLSGNSDCSNPACCTGKRGDVNCTGGDEPDVSDIVRIIDFLYLSHDPLCCPLEADANDSGGDPDISDIVRIIDYLYLSKNPMALCP